MIRVVLFDVDNTLLDFHKCAQESMKRGFADWGIPFTDETYSVYQSINNPLWRQIEDGIITLEDLKRIRWVKVFEALGVDADGVEFETLFRSYLKEASQPVEGAYEVLEYLYPKYRLYSATNGPYLQQLHRLEIAGMSKYMSGNFISEDIGYPKPTKEYFTVCLEELQKQMSDISKEEILIVGDSLTADMKGGVEFGIRTCWYNHNKEEHKTDIEADYVVDHLIDLKEIL